MQYAITPDLPSWSMCLGMPGIYVEVAREVAAHALTLMRLGSPTSVTVEGSGLTVQGATRRDLIAGLGESSRHWQEKADRLAFVDLDGWSAAVLRCEHARSLKDWLQITENSSPSRRGETRLFGALA